MSQEKNLADALGKHLDLFAVHVPKPFPIQWKHIVDRAREDVWNFALQALHDAYAAKRPIQDVQDPGVFPKNGVKPPAREADAHQNAYALEAPDVVHDVWHQNPPKFALVVLPNQRKLHRLPRLVVQRFEEYLCCHAAALDFRAQPI